MKYGLVLAGGGTRGAYQVGVMKAINELGMEISAVCGTSIGAINGAFYVQNDLSLLEEIWRKIRISDVINLTGNIEETNILKISNLSEIIRRIRDKGFDISPFEKMLEKLIDEEKIRKSPIDFGLVSLSVTNKKGVRLFKNEINEGEIVKYLIASASLPVFKKHEINSEQFIDGGVIDNMPINMLIEKGCTDIITVDVRGIGIKRSICGAGVNLIEINCKEAETGILDFNPEGIENSILSGYYDCKKVFGKYQGESYYFDAYEYISLKNIYGERLISGLEQAALIFGLERFCVYGFEEFAKKTVNAYREYLTKSETDFTPAMSAVVQLIKTIREQKNGFIKNKLDIFGKYYNAASALMYFERKF